MTFGWNPGFKGPPSLLGFWPVDPCEGHCGTIRSSHSRWVFNYIWYCMVLLTLVRGISGPSIAGKSSITHAWFHPRPSYNPPSYCLLANLPRRGQFSLFGLRPTILLLTCLITKIVMMMIIITIMVITIIIISSSIIILVITEIMVQGLWLTFSTLRGRP